jgi:hypothetical protein
MDDNRDILDNLFKTFIRELGREANTPQSEAFIDRRLSQFTADLFKKMQEAIREERAKGSSVQARQFWDTVLAALDQKAMAIEPSGDEPKRRR